MVTNPWPYLVALASLIGFALCAWDKHRARAGRGRVPETTLLTVAFLGGSPGLFVVMAFLRHKTRKASFLLRLLVIVLIQGALVFFAAVRAPT